MQMTVHNYCIWCVCITSFFQRITPFFDDIRLFMSCAASGRRLCSYPVSSLQKCLPSKKNLPCHTPGRSETWSEEEKDMEKDEKEWKITNKTKQENKGEREECLCGYSPGFCHVYLNGKSAVVSARLDETRCWWVWFEREISKEKKRWPIMT